MTYHHALCRVRTVFWVCVLVAVVLTGLLSSALRARPSPAAAVAVAVAGILLTCVVALATRLLLALTGAVAYRRTAEPRHHLTTDDRAPTTPQRRRRSASKTKGEPT